MVWTKEFCCSVSFDGAVNLAVDADVEEKKCEGFSPLPITLYYFIISLCMTNFSLLSQIISSLLLLFVIKYLSP